jgi:hypothetical protein
MKKIITLLVFVVCTTMLYAQDIIITKDSKRIEAKIIEVTPTTVKYKKWSYQDGPDILEAKSNIAAIMWGNGEVEAFSVEEVVVTTKEEDKQEVVVKEESKIEKEESVAIVKEVADKNMVIAKTENNNYVVGTGSLSLVRLENGDYMCDGKLITHENIREFYANNCYDAYLMYKKAYNTSVAGYTLLCAGSVCALAGSLTMIGDLASGLALLVTGLCADIACIPTILVAYKQQNKAIDIYNKNCSKKEIVTLNLGSTTNGFGLSINF